MATMLQVVQQSCRRRSILQIRLCSTHMRAVLVPRTGDEDVLQPLDSYAVPSPLAPDACLVRNRYAGLNFIDTYHRGGLYPRELPFIAGQEGAGVVVAVGEEASARGARVGARVVYGSAFGAYAEYTAVPYRDLLDVPDDVPLSTATALCTQGLTAHYLACDAHCGAVTGQGDVVVVHAAAGGTGSLLVQLAAARGLRVVATASSTAKRALAVESGASAALSYDDFAAAAAEGGSAAVLAAAQLPVDAKGGVRVVYDGVGAATHEASLAALGVRGCAVFFGNSSGAVPPIDPLRLAVNSLIVTRPKLPDFLQDRAELAARGGDLFEMVASGALVVRIDETFGLEDAASAHRYIASGKTKGKVLIDVASFDCGGAQ